MSDFDEFPMGPAPEPDPAWLERLRLVNAKPVRPQFTATTPADPTRPLRVSTVSGHPSFRTHESMARDSEGMEGLEALLAADKVRAAEHSMLRPHDRPKGMALADGDWDAVKRLMQPPMTAGGVEAIGRAMGLPPMGPLFELTVPCPMVRKRSKTTKKMTEVPGWYNANHRYIPIVENKMRELWRNAGMDAAVAAGIPKGLDTRLFIEAWIHPTADRTYDAQNLYPSAKGIIDGLIGSKTFPGYGMAAGDDNAWVVGPLCLPGAKDRDNPRVVVRVFALSQGELYPSTYQEYKGRHKVTR